MRTSKGVMGFKFLSMQMIPWWCFHLVGGASSSSSSCRPSVLPAPVRLIGTDGRVWVYRRPVHAAELMAEHPKHLICRSDSFYIGRMVPALSPTDHLLPGHTYFLLPTHFFHSVLSFVTVASSLVLSTPAKVTAGGKPLLRPFDIHKTAAGTLQIRVSDDYFSDEEEAGCGRVCTTEALEKDYKQLVRPKSQQWKPKLETIRESERRWVGFKRRRKKKKTTHAS